MSSCPNCHAAVPGDTNFCPECNTYIPPIPESLDASQASVPAPEARKRLNKKILIWAGIGCIAVFVLLMAFFPIAPAEVPEPVLPVEVPTVPVPTETEADDGLADHAAFLAAADGTALCVEVYVQGCQNWWDNKITVYAQNEDGGYLLYNMACPSRKKADQLIPGTKLRVNGYKFTLDGQSVIIDAAYEILEGNYLAIPVDIADLLGTDDLAQYQYQRICASGLTVVAIDDSGAAFLYEADGSGAPGHNCSLYFRLSDGKGEYAFCVNSSLCPEGSDAYTAVTALNVGDTVDLGGFLYRSDDPLFYITDLVAISR